jgi:hypothetical protein
MALGEVLLRHLAERDDVEVGLGVRGEEITTPGYERQPARGWTVEGNLARVSVSFGPMNRAHFDEGLLFVAGKLTRRMPFDRRVELAGGMAFDYVATVTTDG